MAKEIAVETNKETFSNLLDEVATLPDDKQTRLSCFIQGFVMAAQAQERKAKEKN